MLLATLLLLGATATPPPDTFVETEDHVRIWYTSRGKGSPVIVIHGGPGMDFNSLAADLVPLEKHHRVIYYDQRGGGRSSLAANLSIDDHVRDLDELRRHLGLAKVTLLAHSFGPAIAAQYAIHHPDHVERMIFLGPIPPRKGAFFEEYGATLQKRLTPQLQKRAAELSKSYESASGDAVAACREYWTIETPPRLAKGHPLSMVKSDLCTASPQAIRYGMTKTNETTFTSLGDWDWTADLAHVTAPTLILHGDEDAIPMAMVSEWSRAMPQARLLRLANTGHFPHAEAPEIVFPAIETFLEGNWPKDAVK
jgi:proline iminopeptidase